MLTFSSLSANHLEIPSRTKGEDRPGDSFHRWQRVSSTKALHLYAADEIIAVLSQPPLYSQSFFAPPFSSMEPGNLSSLRYGPA